MTGNKKIKPVKMASSAALVTLVWQIIYIFKTALLPDWIHYFINAMIPGYDLASIQTDRIYWGQALLGALVMGVLAWIFVFVVVWIYNYWEE
jgi:hypothetical protein